jgi:hypothetical protein
MSKQRIIFTEEDATDLVEWISVGETLRDWCRKRVVSPTTVYDWINRDIQLTERIARAREAGEEILAQQCLAIADTPLDGEEVTTKPDGSIETKRGDMLGHRKLQIETRLKLLAKWNPRKWGERQQIEHSGKIGLESLIAGDD